MRSPFRRLGFLILELNIAVRNEVRHQEPSFSKYSRANYMRALVHQVLVAVEA